MTLQGRKILFFHYYDTKHCNLVPYDKNFLLIHNPFWQTTIHRKMKNLKYKISNVV